MDNKVYYPLSTRGGTCLCSDLGITDLQGRQSLDLYAVFPAPPAKVARVTVWVPLTVPFVDIAIGSGSAGPAPGQTVDPGSADLGQPVIRDLVGTSESAEEAVDKKGDDTRVRIAADVLFALNKADLTPRADTVLKALAQQIDASPSKTVPIDGYTDNSGTDAINNPLSQRRAQAVEDRLKGLVTRQGITYQAAGHGSADPVASNDTRPAARATDG